MDANPSPRVSDRQAPASAVFDGTKSIPPQKKRRFGNLFGDPIPVQLFIVSGRLHVRMYSTTSFIYLCAVQFFAAEKVNLFGDDIVGSAGAREQR